MAKQKKWVFTPKRRQSLRKAQEEHVKLVELGLRARGARSDAKRVRVGREMAK